LHCRNHRRESSSRLNGAPQQYDFPVRYAVQSLGWVHMSDEDLTPERSSKAVNRCIMDLSTGRNDINDAVGRWGDVSTVTTDTGPGCFYNKRFFLLGTWEPKFKKFGNDCNVLKDS
jgi:hypothetical protein